MIDYRHLRLLLLVATVLVACGGGGVEGPPEIRYGEDVCEQCQMIISEPRFAAAYVTEEGDFRRFDDIGEMFLYAADNGEPVRTFWVHDFHSEKWLETGGVTFVHNPTLTTPMGWGVAAFADRSEAEAYQAAEGGTLLSAAALQADVEAGDLRPEGMGMSGMPDGGTHAHEDHDHAGHTHDGEMDAPSLTPGTDQ